MCACHTSADKSIAGRCTNLRKQIVEIATSSARNKYTRAASTSRRSVFSGPSRFRCAGHCAGGSRRPCVVPVAASRQGEHGGELLGPTGWGLVAGERIATRRNRQCAGTQKTGDLGLSSPSGTEARDHCSRRGAPLAVACSAPACTRCGHPQSRALTGEGGGLYPPTAARRWLRCWQSGKAGAYPPLPWPFW